MKNYIKVDTVNRMLVMDRTFAKNASIVGSREYEMLQQAKRDYADEGYQVVTRKIKTNSNKKTYSGLTYEYMYDYILTHEPKETVAKVSAEFDEMILISQCHSKAFRYPVIKKWFLEKYPEIVEFGMPKEEPKIIPIAS